MVCSEGKPSAMVCIYDKCNGYPFVCSKTCMCFHKDHQDCCVLRNIKELSNGIESLLKRNFSRGYKG